MTNLISEVKAALQAATPGEWVSTGDAVRVPLNTNKCEWICQLYETDEREKIVEFDNQEANAHLIANSPTWLQQLTDRLEEAVKALEWYEDYETKYDPDLLDHLGFIPIDKDGGKLARTTLKRIKGESG